MGLTLEELDNLAISNEFGGAHNAITCAVLYRKAYSEASEENENLKEMISAIMALCPSSLKEVIESKLNELKNKT